jgi:hypothetical protein
MQHLFSSCNAMTTPDTYQPFSFVPTVARYSMSVNLFFFFGGGFTKQQWPLDGNPHLRFLFLIKTSLAFQKALNAISLVSIDLIKHRKEDKQFYIKIAAILTRCVRYVLWMIFPIFQTKLIFFVDQRFLQIIILLVIPYS